MNYGEINKIMVREYVDRMNCRPAMPESWYREQISMYAERARHWIGKKPFAYHLKEHLKAPEGSAWKRGVKQYAIELLDDLSEFENQDGKVRERCYISWENTLHLLLNGARNWSHYSYSGCSLIYDGDIAERVCCPTELKRKRGGELPPNKRECWLDVQARALYQAALLIMHAWYELEKSGFEI